MKKIYLLIIVLSISFAGTSFGQYTATNSGNWSNSITWAPGAPPSTICTNCTITINTGVTVTLDTHVELSGSSILTLGSGGGAAKIVIQSSNPNATTIQTGYNIVLDYLPGTSKIVLTSNSTIDGTSAGTYDGIFNGPLPSSFYQKAVGNSPNLFLGNTAVGFGPAIYGQSLTGPNSILADGALPILLSDFNVALNDNIANLTWSTSIELNFSHFVVQRSGDGNTWEPIGKVAGKNLTTGASYSFIDPSPLHGNNYYRLQSLDFDGNRKLSDIKFVRGSLIQGFKFGPNPASDHVGITFGGDITSNVIVRLVNQYGAILQQKQITNAAGSTVLLNVNNYPAGIYTLQVKSAEGSQSAFRVLVAH